jgi:hydrogenase maturation protease
MIPFPASADGRKRVIVLGIGNVLLGDEGAGVHALRHLEGDCGGAPDVAFVDGGTLGFTLASLLEPHAALVVIDAARMASPPGTVGVFEGAEMDAFLTTGTRGRSVHEAGLADVMAMAALEGRLPARRALVGIEPRDIDWSSEPSHDVREALPHACRRARELIERWRA